MLTFAVIRPIVLAWTAVTSVGLAGAFASPLAQRDNLVKRHSLVLDAD